MKGTGQIDSNERGIVSQVFSLAWRTTIENLGFLLGFTLIFFILNLLFLFLFQTMLVIAFILLAIIDIIFFYLLIVACIKIVNSERLQLSVFLLDISENLKGIWQFVFAYIILGFGAVTVYSVIFAIALLTILRSFPSSSFNQVSPSSISHAIRHVQLGPLILGAVLIIIIVVVLIGYSLRFYLWPYVLIDKKMDAISALKTSFHLTKRNVLRILVVLILLSIINSVFGIIGGVIEGFIGMRTVIPIYVFTSISLFVVPFYVLVFIYLYK